MSSGATRLRIAGVSKNFEAVHALRDVSFQMAPGELHALVGENGAGKSTLVSIMTGLHPAGDGASCSKVMPVQFRSPLEARAAGIAAVYQDPHLFPHLSVAENILTGQYPTCEGPLSTPAMTLRGAPGLSEQCGKPARRRSSRGGTHSGRSAVRRDRARHVLEDLRLLILDEPTSALTPGEASKLYEVVANLKDKGTTVVWISHRMEEIRRLADTITVLRDGAHVRTSPASELSDDEMIQLMVGRSVVLETVGRGPEPLGAFRGSLCGDFSVPGMLEDIHV